MENQSEQEIEQLRKRLDDCVAQGLTLNSASELEEFFGSLDQKGDGKAEGQKIKDSFSSPFKGKNWSNFTSSVSGASFGATGVGLSVAGLDIMGVGYLNTTDLVSADRALFDISEFVSAKKNVSLGNMRAAAAHLIRAAKRNAREGVVAEDDALDMDTSLLFIED